MPEPGANERRQQRHQRLSVRLPIRISTIDSEIDPSTGKSYFRTSEEICHNVSRGGVFVETPEPVTPGRRLLLELEIPDGPKVQTIGRVAWSRTETSNSASAPESGIGIEFLGGSPQHLSALERYISRLAPRPARATGDTPGPTLPSNP